MKRRWLYSYVYFSVKVSWQSERNGSS